MLDLILISAKIIEWACIAIFITGIVFLFISPERKKQGKKMIIGSLIVGAILFLFMKILVTNIICSNTPDYLKHLVSGC